MQYFGKVELRSQIAARSGEKRAGNVSSGKLAELLRRESAYREAKKVFVAPSPVLEQVRINTLLDGKKLIMPSAGLKEGFFLVKPYTVPFNEIAYAVSLRGLRKHGEKLQEERLTGLGVDLLITEALAVDPTGNRLGDGLGFFDLAFALLAEYGGMIEEAKVFVVANIEQIIEQHVIIDPWDVAVDAVVCIDGTRYFQHAPRSTAICWEQLPKNRVKKINQLWKLYLGRKIENHSG